MQCYTELSPPTVVTHALSLPFTSASANNLVVVKSSQLQLYALNSVITTTVSTPEDTLSNHASRPDRIQTSRLVLIAEFDLAGEVTDIARVKIIRSKSGGEALLVALRDAKLSLVEWDPVQFSLSTISLHYYEREEILQNAFEPDISQCSAILTVDPGSRCAILKFGARHIAIIPFRQLGDDVAIDDLEPDDLTAKVESIASKDVSMTVDKRTPYHPSFVLSLVALDSNLRHPVHLAFLNEYREPTFGILSDQISLAQPGAFQRIVTKTYAVYNLDLEQRASTTLLSVSGLPADLSTIIPLSKAVGGALLVGANCLVHVEQSGKTNGIAVNPVGKGSGSIVLADQSDLSLELEGCVVKQLGLDNRDVLLATNGGQFYVLSFDIDGRSVSRMSLKSAGSGIVSGPVGPTCAALMGRTRMFLGSQDSDSVILGWSRSYEKSKRQRSTIDVEQTSDQLAEIDIDPEEDDDDLYADEKDEKRELNTVNEGQMARDEEYIFRLHDTLLNLGPMSDMTFGRVSLKSDCTSIRAYTHEIITSSGRGQAGAMSSLRRHVSFEHNRILELPETRRVWCIDTKLMQRKSTGDGQSSASIYLFVASATSCQTTQVHKLGMEDMQAVELGEFETNAGESIEFGVLEDVPRIVQVLPTEIRVYDHSLQLVQILPVSDDDAHATSAVVHAQFVGTFILLVKNDGSISIVAFDESNDLTLVPQGPAITDGKWVSGTLYDDSEDYFRLEFPEDDDENIEDAITNTLLFLLGASGALNIYRLPRLQEPVYTAPGLGFVPPYLSPDFLVRRSTMTEKLVEILVTDLGDSVSKAPVLVLRTSDHDTIVYQPYQVFQSDKKESQLHFRKTLSHDSQLSDFEDEGAENAVPKLKGFTDSKGFSQVWVPGGAQQSYLLLKSASSRVRQIPLAEDVQDLAIISTPWCQGSFVHVHGKNDCVTISKMPDNLDFSTGWVVEKIPIGKEINALAYHQSQDAYVYSALERVPFSLPDDEQLRDGVPENESYLPQIEQSTLCLMDRQKKACIDSYKLDQFELITCLETMSLEVSEVSHKRQEMICIGTVIVRGEDLPAIGFVHIFSVIDIVPDPEQPETTRALKFICKEEVRGAVTALSTIGTQGFLLIAQGQKCIVRGLKEDGSLLPVAFIDVQTHVTVTTELPGTGLCIIGDAIKGIWFCGYTEEPYQLRQFGKSPYHIETIAATFLPDSPHLLLIVADADGNLHIFQYDPENPLTFAGHLLLPISSPFHTAHYPTALLTIPENRSTLGKSKNKLQYQGLPANSILHASSSGALSMVKSIPASAQRLLTSLQSHLLTALPHPLGLNPKTFRTPAPTSKAGVAGGASSVETGLASSNVFGVGSSLGMLDGNILKRWNELGSWRRWGGGEGMAEVKIAVGQAIGNLDFL